MRVQLVRIAVLAFGALSAAACGEDSKDLLAPPRSDKLFVVDGPMGGFTALLPKDEDFVDITAGDYHTCARKFNGNVYCWGKEGGPNIPSASTVLQMALTFQGASQIDAGANHTCVLATAGAAAHCWGANDQGQLGLANGQYSPISAGPVAAPITPPGWPAQGTLAFTSISAGGSSTCGQAPSGVYCWGQLGNLSDPRTGVAAPFPISTSNSATALAVGGLHGCVYIGPIRETDCWGADAFGQAGSDPANTFYYPNSNPLIPKMVIFTIATGLGQSALRVSTQKNFTCADLVNGTIQCFGDNEFGSLGNGQSGWGVFTHVPQTVGNGQRLHGVSAGAHHACALDDNSTAWCWGAGLYGQLGNGSSVQVAATPQPVTQGRQYRAIAAGLNHTCAIGTDNHIYCWGQVNFRQLGTRIFGRNRFTGVFEVTNGFSPNPVQAMDPQ